MFVDTRLQLPPSALSQQHLIHGVRRRVLRPHLAKLVCNDPCLTEFGQTEFGQFHICQSQLAAFGHPSLTEFGQFFVDRIWAEGWGPEGWGPEGWSLEGWGPKPRKRGPKTWIALPWSAFPWTAQNFALFFPSLGVFSWNFGGVFEVPGRSSCASPGGPVWWGNQEGCSPRSYLG